MKRTLGSRALVSFASATALVAASATISFTASAQQTPASTPSTSASIAQLQQQQQQDPGAPAPAPAPAPPGDSAVPGSPAAPTLTVTAEGATVGDGQTPAQAQPAAADTPVEAKKPEKKDKWIDKFAGSAFFTQVSTNVNTFAPALQQTQNTTVEQWSSFSPRYALSKEFQLRGRIVASYEYTNSDSTTYRNELRFGDPILQLFYRGIPSFLGGTRIAPFVGAALPLSKESQARTMMLSPSIGFQLSHAFEHVLGGELMLLGSMTYSHPLYKYTTAGLENSPRYAPQCFGGSGTCVEQVGGAANPSDTLSYILLASGEWGKFSPGVLLWMTHAGTYQFKDTPGVQRLGDRTSIRQSSYVAAWLDYHLTDWFTPEVGYQFSRSVLDADGSYGNPIFSRYQDMRVYLGFNVGLDALYKTVTGQGAEAGVVRATNEKRPVLAF